ncbi:LysE family transporter, partial [Ensifer sp. SSB1]|uniref:LysE family transporter n=1 Tax=Ensifer sp. SSB1 TaxID=2795385 RepID=UPI001A57938D
ALRAGQTEIKVDRTESADPAKSQSAARAFGFGFAANALNPKPVFFFLSIFSTVVSAHTPILVKFSYGLVMASCLILWFVGVSLFMTTPRMCAAFTRASKWIDRASGVVFIALGVKLATEKVA